MSTPSQPCTSSHRLLGAGILVESLHEWIRRIRLHAAAPQAEFDHRFLQPIARLAAHVDALPGAPSGPWARSGGLLQACLENAFFCYQRSDSLIFTARETAERRHRLETRWRYLCFLAGLLLPAREILPRQRVASDGRLPWSWWSEPLPRWIGAEGAASFEIEWCAPTDVAAEASSVLALPWIQQSVGADNLQWLDAAGPPLAIFLHLPGSASSGEASLVEALLNDVWRRVQARNASAGEAASAAPGPDSPEAGPFSADRPAQVAQGSPTSPTSPAEVPSPGPAAADLPAWFELLGSSRHARALQQLVEAWNARPPGSGDMRMTPEGAAFAVDMVVRVVPQLPKWCDTLAEAGMIYSPPDAPGKRVHAVAFDPSGSPRPAIVLTPWACRQLRLEGEVA